MKIFKTGHSTLTQINRLKGLALYTCMVLLAACAGNTDSARLSAGMALLRSQNDSLKKEIEDIKPGLGDLMLAVQIHHNKLWFAGRESNWALAQFEHDEITEIIKQAEAIETGRNEVKLFPSMLYPQLDSLEKTIQEKDGKAFEHCFVTLTDACNNCHKAVNVPFNRITIPAQPPFSNQDFRP
ncbi:MAG: hypothetical protein HKL88_05895 [Bacteroidia bacterium]|nr:hypothetical protein [Bacteroidia bacterium]